MAFNSFSIRRIADNSMADIIEVDKMVCEEFGFEFSDNDYGHYFFVLTEEEEKRGGHLGHSQKSISWAGLIHTIVYYSNINYGKSSVYDLEAALAWVREHAILFPYSTVVFVSKLLNFLKQKGFYVFVNFHRDEDCNRDEYVNTFNSYKIFRNESGVFECDDDGVLLRFYPDIQNLLDECRAGDNSISYKYMDYYRPSIHTLIIPEGVTSFGDFFFQGGFVRDQISFPSTLKSIGGNVVFADTCLPDIVIPESVKDIGWNAFHNSKIKSVRFQRLIDSECRRQFEDAQIGTLYLPNESYNQWMLGNNEVFVNLRNAKNIEFY